MKVNNECRYVYISSRKLGLTSAGVAPSHQLWSMLPLAAPPSFGTWALKRRIRKNTANVLCTPEVFQFEMLPQNM